MVNPQIFYKKINDKYHCFQKSDGKEVIVNSGRRYSGKLDTGEGCFVINTNDVSILKPLGYIPLVIIRDSGKVIDKYENFFITPDDEFKVILITE